MENVPTTTDTEYPVGPLRIRVLHCKLDTEILCEEAQALHIRSSSLNIGFDPLTIRPIRDNQDWVQ